MCPARSETSSHVPAPVGGLAVAGDDVALGPDRRGGRGSGSSFLVVRPADDRSSTGRGSRRTAGAPRRGWRGSRPRRSPPPRAGSRPARAATTSLSQYPRSHPLEKIICPSIRAVRLLVVREEAEVARGARRTREGKSAAMSMSKLTQYAVRMPDRLCGGRPPARGTSACSKSKPSLP